MADFRCEYPDGCTLDLWANVVKSKYLQRQALLLDINYCVPDEQVGGKITGIDNVSARVLEKTEKFLFDSVSICIDYEVILIVTVGAELRIVTLKDTYERIIAFSDFEPPLSPHEFKEEVQQSELILMNWNIACDIKGDCEDPFNPCFMTSPVRGTCIGLQVYVDILDKLVKQHNVKVYGELDPEADA